MASVTVIYFSGYGHTERQANAVYEGVQRVDAIDVKIIPLGQDGTIQDDVWSTLEASDAIIFGSPTYMGGPAWQFKKFADASSKPWMAQKWKDKVAGGFTNSASINGDKFSTISYLHTLAMQHGMIWVGTGLMPANHKASQRDDINWLAGFAGALAQSPADGSPEEGPLPGDLETARLFGQRIAEFTKKIKSA